MKNALTTNRPLPWSWWLLAGCILVILVGRLHSPRHADSDSIVPAGKTEAISTETSLDPAVWRARNLARNSSSAPAPTAEEIVASKVSQFGRSRREMVWAIARRTKKDVPPEVEK